MKSVLGAMSCPKPCKLFQDVELIGAGSQQAHIISNAADYVLSLVGMAILKLRAVASSMSVILQQGALY
ncbi:MAG: hypothetical protein R2865_16190 [Deinococcales bacterium]